MRVRLVMQILLGKNSWFVRKRKVINRLKGTKKKKKKKENNQLRFKVQESGCTSSNDSY